MERRNMPHEMSILARRVILWSSLIGLFVSTYLLITYVSGGPIVCGAAAGCEIVRASKWAYSFGLPRPLLGVVFYVGVIVLLAIRAVMPTWQRVWMYRLTMVAASIGFIESAFLTFVQWWDIKAFCVWCLTSAVAATVIFIAAWFDRKEAMEQATAFREVRFLFWSFFVAVIVGAILLAFLVVPRTDGEPERLDPVRIETGAGG